MGCALACAEKPTRQASAMDLDTGDIVLFSASNLDSWVVRLATCSPYSHVAMVLRSIGCSWHDRHTTAPVVPIGAT